MWIIENIKDRIEKKTLELHDTVKSLMQVDGDLIEAAILLERQRLIGEELRFLESCQTHRIKKKQVRQSKNSIIKN